MSYPADHFPGTPKWAQAAVTQAINELGLAPKWQVPLEAIGRYESNFNPGANICNNLASDPIGIFQTTRRMYANAQGAGLIGTIMLFDPPQAAKVAILYISSKIDGYGGYGGIDQLLKRTDRGPGEVLRYWIAHPNATFEDMRPFYHGY